MTLSQNTQAILLLTAPLVSGGGDDQAGPLKPSEYKNLARVLRQLHREPADFLGGESEDLVDEVAAVVTPERLRGLLQRGFALAQALDRWEQRSIWVMSRADAGYPSILKKRLAEDAPPVIYGVGDSEVLGAGGLAVVGSRKVTDDLLRFAEEAGRLSAQARKRLVSGGARGIDQASMRGASDEGGMVIGVLADSLERMSLKREHRQPLIDGRMVLISPYDPAAGFNIGHAMQRNKLIYALSDAALVVNADFNKGGTWAGAVEQLDKLRFVPVFVRSIEPSSKALDALRRKGARPWPNPSSAEELEDLLVNGRNNGEAFAPELDLATEESADVSTAASVNEPAADELVQRRNPSDRLMATVRELILEISPPFSASAVVESLGITDAQAREWLKQLVQDGTLERLTRPVRYRPLSKRPGLFQDES